MNAIKMNAITMSGFLVFTSLLARAAPAEPPDAKPLASPPVIAAQVTPDKAQMGDIVVMKVTVKHAQADALELPGEIDWQAFELVDRGKSERQEGPLVTDELVFKLRSFEVGEHDIPPLKLKVGGQEFATDALPVTVESTVPDGATSHGPDGAPTIERRPDGDPLPIYEYIYWPLYILAAALLGGAVYLFIKRRRARPQAERAAPEMRIAPHEAALQLFKLLRKKDYLGQKRFREFYFEASEILRGYLSQRYAINALDLTTYELMTKLAAITAPGLDRAGLSKWLEHGDFVKFAKLEPDPNDAATMLDFFESLVWNTRPQAPRAVSTEGDGNPQAA